MERHVLLMKITLKMCILRRFRIGKLENFPSFGDHRDVSETFTPLVSHWMHINDVSMGLFPPPQFVSGWCSCLS